MAAPNYLSPDFLRSRGVQITQPLSDWLNRTSFIWRTRSTDSDKLRYQNWVLCLVEDAIEAGGVASKDWAKQSPTMPAAAPSRTPRLLSAAVAVMPPTPLSFASPVDARTRLMEECSVRCPSELRPFLRSAFAEIDKQVHVLGMGYESVSLLRVLKEADNIRAAHIYQQQHYAAQLAPPPPPPPQYIQQHHAPHPQTVEVVDFSRASKRERTETPADTTRWAETKSTFSSLCKDAVKRSTKSKFVGKSNALERKYSRDEPLPEDIRPLSALKKAFEFVFQQSIERCKTQDGMKYLSEQLKGMRQDLRVQNIRNTFAIAVYEASAKASLAVADVGDFNQCQASLKVLYRELPNSKGSIEEFTWYRLAYLAFGGQHDALALEFAELSVPESASKGIMSLCVAIVEGEGASVIEQCLRCPAGHMKALSALFLQRHRIAWLGALASGARGQIPSLVILHALGFHAVFPPGVASNDHLHQLKKRGGKLLFDGSLENATENFKEILTVLKLAVPDALDVAADIASIASGALVASTAFDAQQLSAAVATYSQFLTTRRDAAGGEE